LSDGFSGSVFAKASRTAMSLWSRPIFYVAL
jgi:hypothetical protein